MPTTTATQEATKVRLLGLRLRFTNQWQHREKTRGPGLSARRPLRHEAGDEQAVRSTSVKGSMPCSDGVKR